MLQRSSRGTTSQNRMEMNADYTIIDCPIHKTVKNVLLVYRDGLTGIMISFNSKYYIAYIFTWAQTFVFVFCFFF